MKLWIERAIYGGAGLARSPEGEAVFVPFTLPGELVEARPSDGNEPAREMELIQVLKSAAERVAPRCIHFGACGGCQYQHAAYGAQAAMKLNILRETMERAGVRALPEIALHTREPWEYRNRIRLRVLTVDGALQVGYSRRASNDFLPITMCPIAAPVLWRAAEAMIRLAVADAGARAWMEAMAEMELFCSGDETRIQIALFPDDTTLERGILRREGTTFAKFCERVKVVVPEIAGGGTFIRRGARAVAAERWGADGLLYEAAGNMYWVSRGGFFQVNRFLIDELVELVTAERAGALAWDLYAGVGLFSRRLAEHFGEVVAVEAGEPAARDLQTMLAKMGPRHHAVKATVVEFLRGEVLQRERPELIVMDPPRAGLGAEVTTLLARVAGAEMVYVSCDPVTLGRDLRAMVDSGYRIETMHLVDLFPQTFHLETVTVLRR